MSASTSLTMAPGVYFNEINISQYVRNLTSTKLALVGTASRGPVNTATLITSLRDLLNNFGTPTESYPGLLVGREFFNAGGAEAYFVRVTDDSDAQAQVSIPCINGGPSWVVQGLTSGSFFNNVSVNVSYSRQASQSLTASHTFPINIQESESHTFPTGTATYTHTLASTPVLPNTLAITFGGSAAATDNGTGGLTFTGGLAANYSGTVNYSTGLVTINTTSLGSQNATTVAFTYNAGYVQTVASVPLVPGTVVIKFAGTQVGGDDSAGNLVFTGGYAADYSGTVNYQTGKVQINAIGLGSANATTVNVVSNYWTSFILTMSYTAKNANGDVVNKYGVEQFGGLNPANVLTSIENSQYISAAAAPTTFPVAGTYTLTGGTDGTEGIIDADYLGNTLGLTPTGLQCYAYPDQIDINTVAIPGQSSNAITQGLIQLVTVTRQDTLALLDPPTGLNPQGVADWANALNAYSENTSIDTTYGAIYWPEYTTYNTITGDSEVTPPSAFAVTALVRSQPWQAPAGPNRATALNLQSVAYKVNDGDRSYLAENRINPISAFRGLGTMIMGQQTATLEASALDRVAARIMVMQIEKAVTTALYSLLFEPNTPVTWNRAVGIIQPYLDNLVAKEQIYFGLFTCDNTTNTTQSINNNQMVAVCQIQPLKYAEIITVNFVIEALGGQITENVGSALGSLF